MIYSRAGFSFRAKPLNPQVIKSENDNENLDKNNYAVYGFVAFCILIGILFIIKNKKDKNEFR